MIKHDYDPTPSNWFKSLPYAFMFSDRSSLGEGSYGNSMFYLPISPSNLTISTQFATNIVTTLYGVIEEHSEVRYYDINISGTTGMAPKYVDAKQPGKKTEDITSPGRTDFESDAFDLSAVIGNVPVPPIVQTVANKANTILNGSSGMSSGVDVEKTGYMAFHNFYRFLLQYKKDAAGVTDLKNSPRKTHPLQFYNYKDGNKYDVVIQSFSLVRSAENPMMYNYSIKMRAFNLRSVDSKGDASANQGSKFGIGDFKGQSAFSTIAEGVKDSVALIGGIF